MALSNDLFEFKDYKDGDTWKNYIFSNWAYFRDNIADPLEVVECLVGETTPQIITDNLKEQIKGESTTSNKVEKMLDILLRRGPRVPRCLYDAFMKTHNQHCADRLAPYLLAQEQHAQTKDPSEWPPSRKEHYAMMKEPVTYLKPDHPCCFLQYTNTEEVYSMRRERRGLVYLINNEQFDNLPLREGTHFDRDNLTRLFTDLHFEVIVENNLKASEIMNRTKSISKDVKIKDSDCFVFIILTHGNENGMCGTDGEYVPLTTLTEMFEPNNCPEMNEKPKMFLIQACRGGKGEIVCSAGSPTNNRSEGSGGCDSVDVSVDAKVNLEPNISATQTVHSKSDFLVAYSTPEGALSWRRTDAGSWFIQAIVWIFKFESHVKDLVEMLGKVNYIVSKGKAEDEGSHYVTVSKYESSLRKKLYFFPGICGDKEVHPKCK